MKLLQLFKNHKNCYTTLKYCFRLKKQKNDDLVIKFFNLHIYQFNNLSVKLFNLHIYLYSKLLFKKSLKGFIALKTSIVFLIASFPKKKSSLTGYIKV